MKHIQVGRCRATVKTDWRWWGLGTSLSVMRGAYSNLCLHIGPFQMWLGSFVDNPRKDAKT